MYAMVLYPAATDALAFPCFGCVSLSPRVQFMGWMMDKFPVPILAQPSVIAVAAAVGRTPAQVLLQWSLQKHMLINPRSSNPAHMKENLALFDPQYAFTLSAAQMAAIDSMPVPAYPNNKVP